MRFWRWAVGSACALLIAASASAQVQTGSITGTVADASGAVLPGATVTLTGEKLIGGAQGQTSDASGNYRFDRLPPGGYNLKFELQGFKTIERADIRVNAAFVATVNVKLELGQMSETVLVTGESPTIDTKSNVQQTVMNQEILEGIPSGRDPWSVAKIIPGVAISTYDVGGTQSFQQSSLSSHGSSTNDVSFNIDGATVNWPGGGGGATMLYYDQGMFEEVNYITSAIPAEVMAGGVSINMVTKDAGNRWRGDTKYYFANQSLQSDNTKAPGLPAGFLGNPTKNLYDWNLAGGGALVRDRVWVNGSIRRWAVNKYVAARNPDGSQALDDNTLKNYSGKGVFSASQNNKFTVSYNYNNKIRGHRRNTPPNIMADIAALVQTNPASSTQAKYTGIHRSVVYESSFSVMSGQTNYLYQPNTPPNAVRVVDNTLSVATQAAQYHDEQPNSRTQFDNTISYTKSGWGGDHLFKGGFQFARLKYNDRYDVLNDMYLIYDNGRPTSVQEWNTPTQSKNLDHIYGVFFQDSWTIASHVTLNLGGRYDHNVGILPAQSTTGGQFVAPRSLDESTPVKQNLGVWRAGLVYDPTGSGNTAVKASYSRYGLQVGIDRVTNVNPFSSGSRTCPWTDPNGDGIAQPSEINTAQCTAFPTLRVGYADKANGPRWPYSDELTVGIEHQVITDMRVGVMYYHRTNRDQIGTRNLLVTPDMYVPVTVNVPNGPNGPTTATVYNLASPSFVGLSNLVLDNQAFLDTKYDGIEFTANKRFSHRWQMVAGLTIGQNKGGLNASGGQSSSADLNDPNNTRYSSGIVGLDSKFAFRLSGSYRTPGDVLVAGSLISNGGFPYVSTYSVTRGTLPGLVRSSQSVLLSDRGDERLPTVTMVDMRISRPIRFGRDLQIVPQLEVFNIGNAATVVNLNGGVGRTYLAPSEIVAPRIVRVGFSINF